MHNMKTIFGLKIINPNGNQTASQSFNIKPRETNAITPTLILSNIITMSMLRKGVL